MSAIITKIDPRSPAEKAGLQVGETLLTIGGRAIRDVLDYKFYAYLHSRQLHFHFCLNIN